MALTPDFTNKLILADASITDIIQFHKDVRDIEQSDAGMLYPVAHTYKRVDLGGGAYFHAVDAVNGWQLKFPAPGNYTVVGNINFTIVPVAGVYVDRKTSAAFATVAGTGGGSSLSVEEIWSHATRTLTQSTPTAAEIAAALLAAAQITPIHSDTRRVNGVTITGTGVPGVDEWRPA